MTGEVTWEAERVPEGLEETLIKNSIWGVVGKVSDSLLGKDNSELMEWDNTLPYGLWRKSKLISALISNDKFTEMTEAWYIRLSTQWSFQEILLWFLKMVQYILKKHFENYYTSTIWDISPYWYIEVRKTDSSKLYLYIEIHDSKIEIFESNKLVFTINKWEIQEVT